MLDIPFPLEQRRPHEEAGFTLVELMVVTLVMGIVATIVTAALISLTSTANRNEAMVAVEQSASGALMQMSRDIRSAHSVTFPAGVSLNDTANEVELVDNQADGGSTTVMWSYDATAGTLARQVLVGSTFQTQGLVLSHVANPPTSPLLSYFDGVQGQDISSTTVSNIEACTTAITVDLYVAPATAGTSTIQETDEVALTDQAVALSQPGANQC